MASEQSSSCYYCEIIKKYEDDYPLRTGNFTTENKVYRCAIHSQFQCSKCKKFFHFSWLYWCPEEEKLFCGDCNPSIMKPLAFWNTTYTYSFQCPTCKTEHFDLYYSEFQGQHPWQIRTNNKPQAIISNENEIVWKPKDKPRKGNTLSLENALRIPNRALEVRKHLDNVKFHSTFIPQEKVKLLDVQKHWEETSKYWLDFVERSPKDDQGDINRQLIIDPAMWRLIGDVKGKKILDAGCGNGYFCRILAQKGAIVTGVDQSDVFIKFCKQKEQDQKLGIQYYTLGLEDLSGIEDAYFDLIVSNIVFVDVLQYKQAFEELSRVLKPSGRFIWSNLHPVFGRITNVFYKVPKDSPRNEERRYLLIDRYFDTGGTLVSWGTMQPIWQFDRTLSEYSKALREAGFLIREIVEPKPDCELIKKYPKQLAFDTDRIPLFIIFECLKAHPAAVSF
ncbi:MAG: class I SAM-dependent methyltransferase [Candidatus Hodarchaeales archaeon]